MRGTEALLCLSVVAFVSGCGNAVFEAAPDTISTSSPSPPPMPSSSTTTSASATQTASGSGGSLAALPDPDCDIETDEASVHILCGHQGPSSDPEQGGHLETCSFSVTADGEGALVAIQTDAKNLVRISPEHHVSALSVPVPIGYKTELASDAAGVAHALQQSDEGVVEVSLDTMTKSVIGGAKSLYHRSDTILIAPDGTHHAFTAGALHFARHDGTWSPDPIATPSSFFDARFTLDADGRPLVLGPISLDQIAMAQGALVMPLAPLGVVAFKPVPPPSTPLPSAAPRTAAVLQDADGLRVVWLSGVGQSEVFVPAPLLVPTCPTPQWPDCHTVCHDTGAGVEKGSFAAVRATDGAVWIAYLVSQLDVDRGFAGEDDFVEICLSQRDPATDHSTARLRIVRVSLDDATAELVSEGPAFPDPGLDYYTTDDPVKMRAHRDRLAIAVREHHLGRVLGLRVHQIDITH